ncbi:MAG: YbdD/YjiX family protein [Micrococcus sp.]|nr:YbdD/YjiX family protein [Micrococcus sp.]
MVQGADSVHRPRRAASSTASAWGVLARVWCVVVRAGGQARWLVRQLSGEARYDAYVAHHRAHHPDEPPMSVAEFWVQVHRDAERNPGSRCC